MRVIRHFNRRPDGDSPRRPSLKKSFVGGRLDAARVAAVLLTPILHGFFGRVLRLDWAPSTFLVQSLRTLNVIIAIIKFGGRGGGPL